MSFDMSGWLDDDAWRITGVVSKAHPDGGSYAIPCPSIRDTGLLRRLEKRLLQLEQADAAAKAAAEAGDDKAAKDHDAAFAALLKDHNADLKEYLGVKDLSEVTSPQEAMQRKLLGPVYDEMVADEVSSGRFERVYQAAVIRFTQNEEVVRRLVEFEGKAMALENRAMRREATKAAKKVATKAAPRNSSRRATSRSSRASSATKARTPSPASTRSSKTSGSTRTKTA